MSPKAYLYIGLAIVAVILLIFFYGKYRGKQYTPSEVQLPPDTQAPIIPGSGMWSPGTVTDALFSDLDSVAGFHSSTPYTEALQLSNSQLVAVHNDWNKRYFKDFDKQTLRQAMSNESSVWNYAWSQASSTLSARLKTLGL